MHQLSFHENLQTLHVGTLPNHAYFIPHSSRESALTQRRTNSQRFALLSGEWDFTYYPSVLDLPEDFLSIDLRSAYEALGGITGETLGEDIVNEIFGKFCMGK